MDRCVHRVFKYPHQLKSVQLMLNNNQNTTYNFGRDVFNNNPVTNIYLAKAEVSLSLTSAACSYIAFQEDVMKMIKDGV